MYFRKRFMDELHRLWYSTIQTLLHNWSWKCEKRSFKLLLVAHDRFEICNYLELNLGVPYCWCAMNKVAVNFASQNVKMNCIWKGLHVVAYSITKLRWVLQHTTMDSLQWRNNGCDGASNHQSHHCLLNRLFRRRSKKTPKLRVTGLCAGKSAVTAEFPAQMACNAESVSIWWRHHVTHALISVIKRGLFNWSLISYFWIEVIVWHAENKIHIWKCEDNHFVHGSKTRTVLRVIFPGAVLPYG